MSKFTCYVFVFDSGRDVYTDLSELGDKGGIASSSHLTGPMISSMAGYLDLLNEQWRVVRCNSTVSVFTKREDMHFFAISNKGEDDLLLIRQIQHMQDVLLHIYSPSIFFSSSTQLNRQYQKNRIKEIFLSVKNYFRTDQSYFLMALRKLPLKKQGVMKISALREMMEVKHPKLKYVILTIGTQMLVNVSRSKDKNTLTNQSILTLIGLVLSHFSGKERDVIETPEIDENETEPEDIHIVPLQKLQQASANLFSPRYLQKFSLEKTVASKRRCKSEYIDAPILPKSIPFHLVEPLPPSPPHSHFDFGQTFELDEDQDKGTMDSPLFTLHGDHTDDVTGAEESEEEEDDEVEGTLFSPPRSEPRRMNSDISLNVNTTVKKKSNNNVFRTSVFVDETDDNAAPYNLHAYIIKDAINLLLLFDNSTSEEFSDQYDKKIDIQTQNRKADEIHLILNSKLNTSTVQYYQEQSTKQWKRFLKRQMYGSPGLVHFLIVRRSDDSLYCPDISSLHGNLHADFEYQENMKEYLTNHVRDLISCGQNSLVNGYHTMILARDRFKYFYHVWIDDAKHSSFLKNNENTRVTPLIEENRNFTVLNSTWYTENIVSKQSSASLNEQNNICYELYALFLREVSTQNIVTSTKQLVNDFFAVKEHGIVEDPNLVRRTSSSPRKKI